MTAPLAHRQLIGSLVAGRVGCELGAIPGAPRFRYVPSEEPAPVIDAKPSNRGAVPGVSGFPLEALPAAESVAGAILCDSDGGRPAGTHPRTVPVARRRPVRAASLSRRGNPLNDRAAPLIRAG
jgi:hypothetical protein